MSQRPVARERSCLRTRLGCPSNGRSHTRAKLQQQRSTNDLDAQVLGGADFRPFMVGDRLLLKWCLAGFYFNGICIRIQCVKVDLGQIGQFFIISGRSEKCTKNSHVQVRFRPPPPLRSPPTTLAYCGFSFSLSLSLYVSTRLGAGLIVLWLYGRYVSPGSRHPPQRHRRD